MPLTTDEIVPPTWIGSNLQALLDAVESGAIPGSRITQVISNRKAAYGLERAKKHGVPTAVLSLKTWLGKNAGKGREDYDAVLARAVLAGAEGKAQQCIDELQAAGDGPWQPQEDAVTTTVMEGPKPDLVVLAGFMHIVSPKFLQVLDHAVPCINLHPALPGQFDGIDAIRRAHEAFQRGELANNETGVMVHEVIAEVDRGAPVVIHPVRCQTDESLEALEGRIHDVEHRIIVEGARKILERAGSLTA